MDAVDYQANSNLSNFYRSCYYVEVLLQGDHYVVIMDRHFCIFSYGMCVERIVHDALLEDSVILVFINFDTVTISFIKNYEITLAVLVIKQDGYQLYGNDNCTYGGIAMAIGISNADLVREHFHICANSNVTVISCSYNYIY